MDLASDEQIVLTLVPILERFSSISISNDQTMMSHLQEILTKVTIENKMEFKNGKHRTQEKSLATDNTDRNDNDSTKGIRSLWKLLELGLIYNNEIGDVHCAVCHAPNVTAIPEAADTHKDRGIFKYPNDLRK